MSLIPENFMQSLFGICKKIWGIDFFRAAFFLAVILIILKSNFFVARTPIEFNFGAEWDTMLTAKEYARNSLVHNKFLSYWATYDNNTHLLSINRYTHYPVFSFIPYVIALKFFKAGYASQLMWVNLIYFFLFCLFLYKGIKDGLTKSAQILFIALLVALFYSGYWKAILGSFGIFAVSIAIAPALAYGVIKNKLGITAICFTILCLTMYEAFFPCFFFFIALSWTRKNLKYTYLALGIPLLSLLFRILSNYWFYQSWNLVWLDLIGAFGQRSAECALVSQQTVENIKNYGQVASCEFDYLIRNHLNKLTQLSSQLPRDLLISYGAGFFFFIFALCKAFFEVVMKMLHNTKAISFGGLFVLTYLGGLCLFAILLPALLMQGWTFFILMPISIIGFFGIFEILSPLVTRIKFLSNPVIRMIFILPLLWVFLDRTGFGATLNEKEIHLANSVEIACNNHQGEIYTNLNFNYFTYICKDTNFLLYYADPKPNENLFIRFTPKDNSIQNSPVSLIIIKP